MSNVREQFRAQPLGVNAAVKIGGSGLGGFLAVTSGTLTISSIVDGVAVTMVAAVPVTAGIFTPLPFLFQNSEGATITLGGGASGTLAV